MYPPLIRFSFLSFYLVPYHVPLYEVKCVDYLTDLEKAASGASGACRHFVGNHAILRTFSAKYPALFTENRKRRVEDGELRLDKKI